MDLGLILFANCLLSIIIVIFGIILMSCSAKAVGFTWGYKTADSEKNRKVWREGNRFCGILMIKGGIISILLSIIITLSFDVSISTFISYMLDFVILSLTVILTGKHINKVFREDDKIKISVDSNTEKYNLPFLRKVGFSQKYKLWLLFSSIICAGLSIFIFLEMKEINSVDGIMYAIILLTISFILAYELIHILTTKEACMEITTEYIKMTGLFKNCMVYWSEIYDAKLYKTKDNFVIPIVLKKDKEKVRIRSFRNSLLLATRGWPCSFKISVVNGKELNAVTLFNTIKEQIEKNNTRDLDNNFQEPFNSIGKAVLASLIMSIVLGVIFGLSIYATNKLSLLIAPIGSLLIIGAYNKYYTEHAYNFITRAVSGLICFIQIPIAFITAGVISTRTDITANDVINATIYYIKYVTIYNYPSGLIFIIFLVGICFILGMKLGGKNFELDKRHDIYQIDSI